MSQFEDLKIVTLVTNRTYIDLSLEIFNSIFSMPIWLNSFVSFMILVVQLVSLLWSLCTLWNIELQKLSTSGADSI